MNKYQLCDYLQKINIFYFDPFCCLHLSSSISLLSSIKLDSFAFSKSLISSNSSESRVSGRSKDINPAAIDTRPNIILGKSR